MPEREVHPQQPALVERTLCEPRVGHIRAGQVHPGEGAFREGAAHQLRTHEHIPRECAVVELDAPQHLTLVQSARQSRRRDVCRVPDFRSERGLFDVPG